MVVKRGCRDHVVAPGRFTRLAVVPLAAVASLVPWLAACSPDDTAPNTGGTSGSAGASASGGTGPGGTAGALGQGGTSGSGGSGGQSGTSGSAGSGGAGSGGGGAGGGGPTEVFDPTLPRPSYECRTDVQSGTCLSISGTLAGVAIDRHCARPDLGGGLARNPDAWPVACYEGSSSSEGYFFQLAVPRQAPGNFYYDLSGNPENGLELIVAHDDRGGDLTGSHFAAGALSGKVEHDAGTDHDIISGTFRGTWRMPDANCRQAFMSGCEAATVHGNFRVVHFLKFN